MKRKDIENRRMKGRIMKRKEEKDKKSEDKENKRSKKIEIRKGRKNKRDKEKKYMRKENDEEEVEIIGKREWGEWENNERKSGGGMVEIIKKEKKVWKRNKRLEKRVEENRERKVLLWNGERGENIWGKGRNKFNKIEKGDKRIWKIEKGDMV